MHDGQMAVMRMRARMRQTWDAAARSGSEVVVGLPDAAAAQLDALFADLGAAAHGDGVCLEIGCGNARMTVVLAQRWPEVIGVDVSPAMLERAQATLADAGATNVSLVLVDGERLEGVEPAVAQTVVCFGVVQHLPSQRVVRRLLGEIARVLRPGGEAFVQLPVLRDGARAQLWRATRSLTLLLRRRPRSYHGIRLTSRQLDAAVAWAGLHVVARTAQDEDPTIQSRYPHAQSARLRLRRP